MKYIFIALITLFIISSVFSQKCGKKHGKCEDDACCSQYGWCGTTDEYCGDGC